MLETLGSNRNEMEMRRPKREDRDDPAPAAGRVGALQLIELEDRRLQAAAFLMAMGSCVVLYATVMNRSANAEHVLTGFALFSAGTALALLTLGGAGRAAYRVEEAFRTFF